MVSEIYVNTGSGHGMLPDGTKPLPELILTNHRWGLVAFNWGQMLKKSDFDKSLQLSRISQGPMS